MARKLCRFLTVCSMLFLYITGTNNVYHCTEPNLLQSTVQGEKLEGFLIENIPSTTLMNCGKECGYQTNCVAFNFNLQTGQCELNRNVTSAIAPLISSPGFLYAEKNSWINLIGDPCRYMTCLENQKCVVKGEGLSAVAVCIIYDCNVPQGIADSTSVEYYGTVTGYNAIYSCGGPGVLKKTLNYTCDSNGRWVGSDQCRKLESCYDVQRCDPNLPDGEYWIYPSVYNHSERVKVYCNDLHTATPTTYVTLVHKNFVKSTNLKVEINGTDCITRFSSESRLGGATFHKVRINIVDMSILQDDRTFTTDLVGIQQYATVYDCTSNNPSCDYLEHGFIQIDTRDTGLMLANTTIWLAGGTNAEVRFINRESDHIIKIGCSGLCGKCYPQSPFRFVLDPNSNLTDASANEPFCV